ncbi:hypothetical protein MKW92_052723 [Papaver armeniacum]|nr:hypothetical protein MKW92_052723 [Papaver armeniacum]
MSSFWLLLVGAALNVYEGHQTISFPVLSLSQKGKEFGYYEDHSFGLQTFTGCILGMFRLERITSGIVQRSLLQLDRTGPLDHVAFTQPFPHIHCNPFIASQKLAYNHCYPSLLNSHYHTPIDTHPLLYAHCHTPTATRQLPHAHCHTPTAARPLPHTHKPVCGGTACDGTVCGGTACDGTVCGGTACDGTVCRH